MKVKWLGDQQASSRLIAESRAGRHTADVWTFSLGALGWITIVLPLPT